MSLHKMPRDLEYENNNIGYDCQYTIEDGGGIKCKNYELCKAVLPKWWFDCKNNYICTGCDMFFGELELRDNIECPVCYECKRGISQPRCQHFVCIDCFKRCYYVQEDNRPEFPYPEIEDEYDDDDDHENPKWETDYPLIRVYRIMCDIWEEERYEQYERESYLRTCPVCRK